MDIFKQYATDEKSEVEGAWCYIGDGCSILVARADNDNFENMLLKTTEANREALYKGDEAADKLDKELLLDVLSSTILLGWRGLEYKGKKMRYSKDNAKTLLSHKDFRKVVMRESSKMSNFLLSAEEKDIKN